MRRVLSGGVLLSLGLLAAHGAVEAWVEARAVVALEAAARSLPEGARLSWARLDARPLRLALEIEDVRLDLPAGHAVRSIGLGTLRLAQAGGGVDRIGRLGAARATDLVIQLPEDRGTLRIAELEGEGVEIEALQQALASPDPLAALAELRLGPVRARDLVLEGQGGRLVLPSLAIEGYAERRLRGFASAGLELKGSDGETARLQRLSVALLDLHALDEPALAEAGQDSAAAFALLDRLAIEAVRVEGLEFRSGEDSVRLAGLGLGRAGGGRVESFALDGLAIETEDGRGELAQFSLALLDWSAVRIDRLATAAALLADAAAEAEGEAEQGEGEQDTNGGQDGNDGTADADDQAEPESEPADEAAMLARSFAGLELAGELLRLRIGPIRIERLAAGGGEAGLALGRFAFEGLEAGRLGALALEGVEARGGEGVTVRLASWQQSALRLGPVDLAERVEAAPRTVEGLQALSAEAARLPWQGSAVLAGLAVEREGRTGFALGRFALDLEETGPRKRTIVTLDDLLLDPAALGAEEAAAGLQAVGSERLALRARFATAFDQASHELALEELSIDAPGQLAVRLSLQARLGADPTVDPVTAWTDAELLRAEFVLRDQGAVERFLAGTASGSPKKRPDLAKELVRDIRREEPGRSLLDNRRAGELEKFLTEPRSLVIRLAPPKPVSFLAALMGTVATPAQAARTLGLSIEARDR